MSDPAYLVAVRESYDRVAEDYLEIAATQFKKDTLGRGMLAAFAEFAQVNGSQPVADVGCGPGHVTDHLRSLGVPVFGVDISPNMVALARRTYPAVRFKVGSMTSLDVPDGHLGGIVAWWSILHLPREVLPAVFAEFRRALVPGGSLLLGFHVGDERLRPGHCYGHPVSYDIHLLPPEGVAELLAEAGLVVTARLRQEPAPGLKRPQACLLAHRPASA